MYSSICTIIFKTMIHFLLLHSPSNSLIIQTHPIFYIIKMKNMVNLFNMNFHPNLPSKVWGPWIIHDLEKSTSSIVCYLYMFLFHCNNNDKLVYILGLWFQRPLHFNLKIYNSFYKVPKHIIQIQLHINDIWISK